MKDRAAVGLISLIVVLITVYVMLTGDVEFVVFKLGKAVIGALVLRLMIGYMDRIIGKTFKEYSSDWTSTDWSHYASYRILGLCIYFGLVFM